MLRRWGIMFLSLVRLYFPGILRSVPGKGLQRKLLQLFKRELLANSSPVKLAQSLALGVFMGIFPVYGFQVIVLLFLSLVLRLNRPLALLGVNVSFAPFMPFWIAAGVALGNVILSPEFVTTCSELITSHLSNGILDWVQSFPVPGMIEGIVKWFFGSVVLAVIGSIGTFFATYPVICSLQRTSPRSAEPGQNP